MRSLRARLALALAFLLLLVLALSAVLMWTTHVSRTYFQHGQHAQEQLASYLTLSAQICTELLRAEDQMFTSGVVVLPDVALFRSRASQLVDELERGLAQVDSEEERERERATAGAARALLATLGAQLEQAIDAHREGRLAEAGAALSLIVRSVDADLIPLVDRVVQTERREIAELGQREAALTARVSAATTIGAALAVLLTAITGFALFRSITRPVQALVRATEGLAAGRLDSRVEAQGPEEFAQLASSFNRMAADLEAQTASLEQARRTLEERVQQRTAALERKHEQLRRSDRSRRRFFADVSHELRTPLTLIQGEAELALERGPGAAEQHSALARILDLARQMASLVDDMLFLARSDAARAPSVHLAPLDLRRLVEQTYDGALSAFERVSRSITLAVSGDDFLIRGDEQRLRQLLRILLDNALHYTREGDRVELILRQQDGFVRLELVDTGVGIEAHDVERIFRRFYRGAAARQLNATGTGLGLSVARSIVQAHGGTIEARSTPERGTTFVVQFPCAASEKGP